MNNLLLPDRLVLDVLSRDAILNALRNWAVDKQFRSSLSKQIWRALEDFAAGKYIDQSRTHVVSLVDGLKGNGGLPLIRALQHLVRQHFVWRDRALFKYETVLQTQRWLAKCNPIQPQCYLWAIDAPTHSRNSRLRRLPSALRRELLSNAPLLPEVDEPVLHGLRHAGLPEIHRHLNGSLLPCVLWTYLIASPHRMLAGELAGEVDRLNSKELIALLHTARDLRAAILRRLLIPHVKSNAGDTAIFAESRRRVRANSNAMRDLDGWNSDVLARLGAMYETMPFRFFDRETFTISGLSKYRDPAARLPQASDQPLSSERALLLYAFEHLHANIDETVFGAALHAYLLIQNLIWRALTKPRDYAKGFDRFDGYHGLFLREPEKAPGKVENERFGHRLLQAERTGGVRWAELRVVPASAAKGGPWCNARILDRVLNRRDLRELFRSKSCADGQEYWKIGSGLQLPLNTHVHTRELESRKWIGLIFHFIKRKDYVLAARAPLWPCRHARLRREVKLQAVAIDRLRRSERLGQYVLGIDAAGFEVYAAPEVFAPAITWLRERPALAIDPSWLCPARSFCPDVLTPLGLTYHAGEDFRHLLSGLRAVDEAMRFLRMRPGDRIGHGLALGLDYRTWCIRIGGLVAMPRGQRLDDLVWLRTRLATAPSGFDKLAFEIDSQIEQLSREIFGGGSQHRIPDQQVLYAAWKLRDRDPLRITSRRLPWDYAVQDIPQLFQQAFELHYDYHYNPRIRSRYDEFIRVPLMKSLEEWHAVITWAQDQMLHELVRRRIPIEINPTSNLSIGLLDCMTEHPVFRWHPPTPSDSAIRPYIMVGSDDPGVLATELLFEYATLSKAAEERGATPRQVAGWLEELRETSRKFSFIDTRA